MKQARHPLIKGSIQKGQKKLLFFHYVEGFFLTVHGVFCKVQEILYLTGAGILQNGPGNAEIIGFKDFNFALKILQGNPKIGIVLTH